jgi:hypothetical protein
MPGVRHAHWRPGPANGRSGSASGGHWWRRDGGCAGCGSGRCGWRSILKERSRLRGAGSRTKGGRPGAELSRLTNHDQRTPCVGLAPSRSATRSRPKQAHRCRSCWRASAGRPSRRGNCRWRSLHYPRPQPTPTAGHRRRSRPPSRCRAWCSLMTSNRCTRPARRMGR